MSWNSNLFHVLITAVMMCFITSSTKAQIIDTTRLDTLPIFYSLDTALLNPTKVYRLSLQKMKMKEVPPEVFSFPNLNELDLSRNRLTSIPQELSNLRNLQLLKLSRNRFEKFPESVCILKNLLKLSIDQNMIDTIPDCVGNLTNLVTIDAWKNDFNYYSPQLRHLKKLRWIDLRGILMSYREQELVIDLLPRAKVITDEPCNCDF